MMQGNMFLRNDTIFGVCQALGEDLGFNPNFLRVALILPIFWFPAQMIMTYFALGLVVMVSRYAFPDRALASNSAQVKVLPAKSETTPQAPEKLSEAA